jgi:hypothetical protein
VRIRIVEAGTIPNGSISGSRYTQVAVKRTFQITISNKASAGDGNKAVRVRPLGRVKFYLAVLLFAVVLALVVVIVLVVGSILAAILWIALVLTIAGLMVKAMFRHLGA